jgi:hypothetical protein
LKDNQDEQDSRSDIPIAKERSKLKKQRRNVRNRDTITGSHQILFDPMEDYRNRKLTSDEKRVLKGRLRFFGYFCGNPSTDPIDHITKTSYICGLCNVNTLNVEGWQGPDIYEDDCPARFYEVIILKTDRDHHRTCEKHLKVMSKIYEQASDGDRKPRRIAKLMSQSSLDAFNLTTTKLTKKISAIRGAIKKIIQNYDDDGHVIGDWKTIVDDRTVNSEAQWIKKLENEGLCFSEIVVVTKDYEPNSKMLNMVWLNRMGIVHMQDE